MDFTIVTPSFRQLDHLGCCIASVADQTGVTVEHIVMDAGSEGFAEFADKMRRRWPDRPGYRRLMSCEPDQGMYDAINKGLRKGSGRICAYLNCDEQYLPEALQEVRTFWEKHSQAKIVQGGFLVIDAADRLVTAQMPVRLFWPHVATSHLPNFSCGTFFARSLMEREHAWFDHRLKTCADWTWILQQLRSGHRILRLRKPLALFRETGKNQGLSPQGEIERRQILTLPPWRVRVGAPLWRWGHRLGKLFSGHYFPRFVRYAVWRESSDRQRTECGPFWAHGIWWSRLGL